MNNVFRVFVRDLKRLAKTPAAWSVALFLIVLPSLYTWFNVEAFWNPYDNTGNMRVCVVNEDRTINNDTLGELCLGDQVVEKLASEDRLGWAFVSRDEAMEEVDSGRAYAAFIIPSDFSSNVATLTTGDFKHPQLQYYVNEKVGPVAPKVTDTGANALDTTINDAFFSTVSSTVASTLNDKVSESTIKMQTARSSASTYVQKALEGVADARNSLEELSNATDSASVKVVEAKSSLGSAKQGLDKLASNFSDMSEALGDANEGLIAYSGAMGTALDSTSQSLVAVANSTNAAIAQTAVAIELAKKALGGSGSGTFAPDYDALIKQLEKLDEVTTDPAQKEQVDQSIQVLKAAQQKSEDLSDIESTLDDAEGNADGAGDSTSAVVAEALKSVDAYRAVFSTSVLPAISNGLTSISSTSAGLGVAVASEKAVVDQVAVALDQLDETLAYSKDALSKTDALLVDLSEELKNVQADLDMLGTSNALSSLFGGDGVDPDKIADFMMSPTKINAERLYAVDAYGSAMAPLFMNLTLWIGVFMLMVILKLEVDDEGIENSTITQRTLGRGLLLAIMSALQAVVCCAGCLVLGVQTASVPLFFLTAIIASLAYLGVQYTLSTTLQHVGKGICIILVFVQIPGATGLYPIEMTPDFFHWVYPWFPFTYGINAIRETICGFYGFTWLANVGMLLLFAVGWIIVGVLVRPYLANVNRMFARQIAESDIINGETVELPARRYRMSQVIRAFSDRGEYRAAIDRRVARYMELYPSLKGGAVVAAFGLPLISTTLLMLLGVDKVIILTTWLVWVVLVMLFLIVIEYLRDYLGHLVSLESMSAEDIRSAIAERDRFTRLNSKSSDLRDYKPARRGGGPRAGGDAR